jgi:protein-S-isoprenylcysteine O-methyltransferase Ste14
MVDHESSRTMRLPGLGPRGEGWVVAQTVLIVGIVIAGVAGPGWPATISTARTAAGITIGVAGVILFAAGVVALGDALTPLPKPLDDTTLRVGGAYRHVRHPIYGGVLLMAFAGSLLSSPIALALTALLALLFEAKSRHEESMLVVRYPEYETYRRRIRRRFVPGVH